MAQRLGLSRRLKYLIGLFLNGLISTGTLPLHFGTMSEIIERITPLKRLMHHRKTTKQTIHKVSFDRRQNPFSYQLHKRISMLIIYLAFVFCNKFKNRHQIDKVGVYKLFSISHSITMIIFASCLIEVSFQSRWELFSGC